MDLSWENLTIQLVLKGLIYILKQFSKLTCKQELATQVKLHAYKISMYQYGKYP